jgi:hypothetical protein
MRFLRHFGAACLLVGLVTGIGVAWSHFGQWSLPGELHGHMGPVGSLSPGGKLPPGAELPHGLKGVREVMRGKNGTIIVIKGTPHSIGLGLNSMFQRVNWPYAERTVVIEAAVIVGVVILDSARRRVRKSMRRRRLRALTPEAAAEAP